ncbi:hypothetical protein NPIRD3C_0896 [Nitrosopumilus piranensis]|uniref:Uncharacterized protein n=1 Tax=Nitrosopumilus piranensis TaxID=1582439 RepID=A0A0C5BQU4_9ARCH|nr:hypothetical protein NPIRD3C_0896 [Nitrosopumilus piranensis]
MEWSLDGCSPLGGLGNLLQESGFPQLALRQVCRMYQTLQSF